MSLSIYQEDLKSEQLIHNEAGFYKLLKVQGIILIAQLITVSHGSNSYQILLAWNPDMIIEFCEVGKGNGNVRIILESRLLTFMNKLWTNQRGFKCRNDPTHIIPPGCLLLRQEDAQKQIRDQCSLLLTAEGLDMDKLLNKRPTKWREGYAYVHVQGSRTAENVIHLLMKLYPGIKEPRTQQHNDNIMLAVKCYNLRRSEGSTLAQKYKDYTAGIGNGPRGRGGAPETLHQVQLFVHWTTVGSDGCETVRCQVLLQREYREPRELLPVFNG